MQQVHPTLWFLDTNDLESQSLAVWQARLLYTSSADNKVSKLPLFCKLRLNNRTITDDSLQQEKLAKHSVDFQVHHFAQGHCGALCVVQCAADSCAMKQMWDTGLCHTDSLSLQQARTKQTFLLCQCKQGKES